MRMGRTAAALRAWGPAATGCPAGDGPRGRSRLSMATETCTLRLPAPCQVEMFGLHAQSSHPPPERVKGNPLRTPAAAGGADAAPGRTWNGGPASIPGP